jgi:NADPH:quinone reductase-like Zn-dependent oxidoreductase
VTLHGVLVRPDGDRLSALAGLLERGVLSVEIRAVLPLEQAEEAQRLVEEGHGRGKVVLTIDTRNR